MGGETCRGTKKLLKFQCGAEQTKRNKDRFKNYTGLHPSILALDLRQDDLLGFYYLGLGKYVKIF